MLFYGILSQEKINAGNYSKRYIRKNKSFIFVPCLYVKIDSKKLKFCCNDALWRQQNCTSKNF